MDSVTQATLGAAVGQAVLGRKVGWKAALWGAVAGTLPDLDIVAYPFLDEVAKLSWHRGPSHAFFFHALAAPMLGWLIYRLNRRTPSWREWTLLIYLGFVTHVLLDAFTVYGTQLFRPFSRFAVAWNTIAIIDPLYTLPLLIGVIASLILRRPRARRLAVTLGLSLSTAYLALTAGLKLHVDSVARAELNRQEIPATRFMTIPTLMNTVLWQITAETDDGYYVSDYSLFDRDRRLIFDFVPRGDSLLGPIENASTIAELRTFSKGYYVVSRHDGRLRFSDLRFGELGLQPDSSYQYVFSWDIVTAPDGAVTLERRELTGRNTLAMFQKLWERLRGDTPPAAYSIRISSSSPVNP